MSPHRISKSRRVTWRLALALIAGLTFGACGSSGGQTNEPVEGSWEDIVAAANDEGSVTLYTTQVPDRAEDLVAEFEAKYPEINVELVAAEDTELIPRVEAEDRTGNGVGDVYVTASEPWIVEHTDFVVEPLGPSFDAPDYDRAANVTEDGYFAVAAFVGAFGWNTDLYSGDIRDWPDFLDPSLSGGKIGVVTPDTATKVGFYRYLNENYGDDFVEKLAAQEPQVYARAPSMSAALTSGEIAAATFVEPLITQEADGAPVDWGLGESPWGVPFYGLILRSSPHPNAAQLLADFIITRSGQEAFARGSAAVLPDVPGTVTTMAKVTKLPLEELTTEVQQEFTADWDELFTS
jgi:iron(III) transport system substrate-binding protein